MGRIISGDHQSAQLSNEHFSMGMIIRQAGKNSEVSSNL